MKNASLLLSILALAGVLILSVLTFTGKKSSGTGNRGMVATNPGGGMRIAYVDIDSFENSYQYLKSKREEFNKRQLAMQSELQRSAQQLQSNAEAFQQKVQSGNISQSEGEATQRKLLQMQQSLQAREQSLTEQLLKEKDEFNEQLHTDLDKFLKEYNKDKNYDYILSYTRVGSPILLTNEAYNITADVIRGMNERRPGAADSTKKKK